MEIEDYLQYVVGNLVSLTRTEPFVKYLFSRLCAEWIDVIQTCEDLGIANTLHYFDEISAVPLMASWLYFPSENGDGFRMIIFFSESPYYSNIAIYNAAHLLNKD